MLPTPKLGSMGSGACEQGAGGNNTQQRGQVGPKLGEYDTDHDSTEGCRLGLGLFATEFAKNVVVYFWGVS